MESETTVIQAPVTVQENHNKSEFFERCIAITAQRGDHPGPSPPPPRLANNMDVPDNTLSQSQLPTFTSYPGAFSNFYGLPSNPICVYRTGDEWPVPKGPQAQRIPREARPICNHPLQAVWASLGIQVYRFLDSHDIKWSTIDPVCFAEQGGKAGPLYLWIGIDPGSLSSKDAQAAAIGCKLILSDAQFPDVEIAFRESTYTFSAGPQLLNHVPILNPIADLRSPFTPALGIQISPQNALHFEGTGALYLRESSDSDRVFLLTARHVVLPPSMHHNELYECKGKRKPAQGVVVLGRKAYEDALEDIMINIGHKLILIETYNRELGELGKATEDKDAGIPVMRQQLQANVGNEEAMIVDMYKFHNEIAKHWVMPSQRVLGYVLYAPPISYGTGPKQFTEDWAVIDIDCKKIDWAGFKGNIIYLGKKISPGEFVLKMHPHPQGRSSVKFPVHGLLQVKGVVKEDEIRKPKQLNANGDTCLIVIKNGRATGVTIGYMSSIESFVRHLDNYGMMKTSMEVAVYPYSRRDGTFSAAGDSGSIVVDGLGRIVGLLTGGAGATEATDVTYLTPYFWIEEQIKKVFPNSFLYHLVD